MESIRPDRELPRDLWMPNHDRQRWSSLLRVAICLAAITWLACKTKWSEIDYVWRHADKGLLLLSVLVYGPAPALIAVRLRWLLQVHNIHLTTWQAIKVTFAGNFIINTLPLGTPGGDSVKAYYIARDTPHKHEAITVVFFDRLIGVIGLVLMAGIVVLLDWHNPAFKLWGRLIGVIVVAMVVGGTLYFSDWSRRLLRLHWLLSRLPLGQHLQRIDRAVLEFREHPRRVLACLVLTNILQLECVFGLFLCGWAMGMIKPGFPWSSLPVYLAYAPICYLTGVLPIGVMETTFQQLFSQVAQLGSRGAALSLSLFGVRFTQLVWSLPGGLIVLRSRPKAEDLVAIEGAGEDHPNT
jgi:glycosyltransferase 2 family protein